MDNTWVIIIRELEGTREFILPVTGVLVIGRDTTCDVSLKTPLASRRHARIININGTFYVEDLGSRNGTFVDNQRVKGYIPLRDGTRLVVGDTTIHVSCNFVAYSLDHRGQVDFRDTDISLPPELLARRRPDSKENLSGGLQKNQAEEVECSIFAPPQTSPGSVLLVQLFAHTPPQAETADRMARQFDDESQRRGFRTLDMLVPLNAKLTFHLQLPNLFVAEPIQHISWRGRPAAAQFSVAVPSDFKPGAVVGTACVSLDSVPLGHVKFKLEVTLNHRPQVTRPAPGGLEARRYRKAFISYASSDRDEVLKRVQMLRQVGIDFFQDILDLDPGSRWEMELYRHIDDADLFLLFWSSSAQQSRWVLEEVRYALRRKGAGELGEPEIRPVVIEGPPPPPPPEELSHLHFNDYFLYLIGRGA